MRKVLIVIYSLFSIIAFLALCGITGFLLYTRYTDNVKEFEKHIIYIKKDISTSYNEFKSFDSKLFRSRIKNILKNEDHLFLITLYSPGKGLLYGIEKRVTNSKTLIKSPIVTSNAEKDPDWEGKPAYMNLPYIRVSFTKKLVDEPMIYMELLFYPFLKNEITGILKWGFLSLILWLMVTILIRLFAVTKPHKLHKVKISEQEIKNEEYYNPTLNAREETTTERPHLKEVHSDSNKGSFHTSERKGTEQLFSPQTGLGWKEHLSQRLGFEINRTASFNQDMVLAFIMIDKFGDITSGSEIYETIAKIILATFPFQDLAFEYGKGCYGVILPDTDLYEGIKNLEIFQKKISGKVIQNQAITVSIGLSSRNGRLLSPATIIREAQRALERATEEGRSRIIAFKADPEKYRKTLSEKK
ncbi:MAG: diguanylate cyclase [Spirochaetales bacterium]|nr:diguanylate cyclase [Spirochaetales bacterium]